MVRPSIENTSMLKTTFFCLTLLLTAGFAAAQSVSDAADLPLLGVVEKTQTIERLREPSNLLMAFGLLGGLAYAVMAQSTAQTQQHTILNANGEMVSVVTDQEFPVGSCVHIVPDAITPGNYYPYGQVSLRASDRCAENGLATAK